MIAIRQSQFKFNAEAWARRSIDPSGPCDPCPDCGRAAATHLTLTEACERDGYGQTDCTLCLLTDARRDG